MMKDSRKAGWPKGSSPVWRGGGWKRIYGGASEAPSNERDGTDRFHLRNTAPVLDPTHSVPWAL